MRAAGLVRRLLALDATTARYLNGVTRRSRSGQVIARLGAGWLAGAEVLLMLALACSGQRRTALRMLSAVATVYGASELLGLSWRRERPFVRHTDVEGLLAHRPERSFPSRHVAAGLAMAAIAHTVSPALGRTMAALAWLLGVGRVAAGLHYPSDVLAGAVLGTLVGRLWRCRSGA